MNTIAIHQIYRHSTDRRHISKIRYTAIVLATHALLLATAQAQQITATAGAIVGDAASNGTPIIHIAPPSTAGVSLNKYSTFNTDIKGAIFNNSTTAVNSVLAGGTINRNVQFGTTAAKVIVNQVAGSKSLINGKLEVAGTKADIIVANPTGISCTNCGFINTSKSTLVSGTPNYTSSGVVQGFSVVSGSIDINGADGGSGKINVIADTASIEGIVRASEINIIAGANNVLYNNYLTATPGTPNNPLSPRGITIKSLADVQAGKIYLVTTNTEAGREEEIGNITLDGKITSSGASGIFMQSAGSIFQSGEAASTGGGDISLNGYSISIYGKTASGIGDTLLNAGNLVDLSSGFDISGNNVTLQTGFNPYENACCNWISLSKGKINATDSIYIQALPADNPSAYAQMNALGTEISAGRNISIAAEYIQLTRYSSYGLTSIRAGGDIDIYAKHDLQLGINGNSSAAPTHATSNIHLTVESGGDFHAYSDGSLSATKTNITASGNAVLHASDSLDIIKYSSISANDISTTSDLSLNISNSKLNSNGDIFVFGRPKTSDNLSDIISASELNATRDITISGNSDVGIGSEKNTYTISQATSGPKTCYGGGSSLSFCFTLGNGSTIQTDTYITTKLNAQGNIVIQSNDGIVNLDGSQISTAGNLVIAGQSVGIFGPTNLRYSHIIDGRTTTDIWDETEITGKLHAQGDISILATGNPNGVTEDDKKGDIFITGADVASLDGHVSLVSQRDLDIANDVTVDTYYERFYQKKKRLFYTKRTERITSSSDQTIIPSLIAGQTISIAAGQDLTVAASDIQATGSIGMHADRNLELLSTGEIDSSYSFSKTKKTGIFGSDWGLTIGSKTVTQTSRESSVQQTSSSVSSLLGDILISAGGQYSQLSSEVLSPTGDININAAEIAISTNNNTNSIINSLKMTQTGVTLSASHPLLSAAQTVHQMEKAKQRSSSGHTQALAVLTSAMTLHTAYKIISEPIDFKDTKKYEYPELNRWTITASLGYSSSSFESISFSSLPVESSILAGGDLSINATGSSATEQGDISIIGSALSAGQSLSLRANNDIHLVAAKGLTDQSTRSHSSSASIGISVSASGASATFAASGSRGFSNGYGTTYFPVNLSAGLMDDYGRLSIESGRDVGIKGATISAHSVSARVGTSGIGSFSLISPQDTSDYIAKESSWGISASVPIPGFSSPNTASSIGASYSQFKLLADFQSAREQTAIRAGDGGFDINVNGKTTLTGAAIASTAAEEYNHITTRTLVSKDMQNYENASGVSQSLSLQYSDTGSLGGSSYGYANIDRSSLGATKTAISPATIDITSLWEHVMLIPNNASLTTPYDAAMTLHQNEVNYYWAAKLACGATDIVCQDTNQAKFALASSKWIDAQNWRNITLTDQSIQAISRDVNAAHQPVAPTFDANQATIDLKTGSSVMAAFTRTGYEKIGDYALTKEKEAKALRDKANRYQTSNPTLAADYDKQAQEIDRLWGPSGLARAALHAVVGGAAWGSAGALASATNVLSESFVDTAVRNAMLAVGLNPDDLGLYNTIALTAKTALGGALAGGQGAAATFNADANNRQLHPNEYALAKSKRKEIAKELSRREGREVTESEAEGRILRQLLRNVNFDTAIEDAFRIDENITSIMGCQLLKCNYQINHSDYYDSKVNAQYVPDNLLGYKLAAQQKDKGITAADRLNRAKWSSTVVGLLSGVYSMAESLNILATGRNFNDEDESRWLAVAGILTAGASRSTNKIYRLTMVDEVGKVLIVNGKQLNPKWLNDAGELTWINPLTNQVTALPDGSVVHIDHIFPESVMMKMQDFKELPSEVRKSILNNPINLQPMVGSANMSKQAKVEFDGNGGWRTWNGEPINSQYKVYLENVQQQIVGMIKNAKQ